MFNTTEQEETIKLFNKNKSFIRMNNQDGELSYAQKYGRSWTFFYVDKYGWINGEPPILFFNLPTSVSELKSIFKERAIIDAEEQKQERRRLKEEREAKRKRKQK